MSETPLYTDTRKKKIKENYYIIVNVLHTRGLRIIR